MTTITKATLGVAGLLRLAAAPTFAFMALATGAFGSGSQMPCSMAMTQDTSMLRGMTMMYVLMAVFHAGPWLKLLSSWASVWLPLQGTAADA